MKFEQLPADTAAWVTGGASGLGAATAAALQQAGMNVSVFDLEAALSAGLPEGLHGVACDVSSAEAIATAVAAANDAHGAPRVLVNCAGIAPAARTVSRKGAHDPGLFAKVIAINLVGSFQMSAAAAELMCAADPLDDNERGVIINTASVAAYDGQIGQAAYASSKAGIAGLTLPMARDLSSLGVRVCAIAPGIFATPLLTGLPEDVQQSLAAQVPFPSRLGNPDEFAQLALHIVENSMLNGEVIRLDGAIRMGMR